MHSGDWKVEYGVECTHMWEWQKRLKEIQIMNVLECHAGNLVFFSIGAVVLNNLKVDIDMIQFVLSLLERMRLGLDF